MSNAIPSYFSFFHDGPLFSLASPDKETLKKEEENN
jgi:hypothetical protein